MQNKSSKLKFHKPSASPNVVAMNICMNYKLYYQNSLDATVNAVNDGMSIRIQHSKVNNRGSHGWWTWDTCSKQPRFTHTNGHKEQIVDAVKWQPLKYWHNKATTKGMKIGGNCRAGKGWRDGVRWRSPDLVIRKPEKLASTWARMINGRW